eukprot:gene7460-7670_t
MLKKLKRGKISEHAFDVATGLSSDDEVEEAGAEAEAAVGSDDDMTEQQAHRKVQPLQLQRQVVNGRRHAVEDAGVLQPPCRSAVQQEQQLRKRKKRRQKKRLQQQHETPKAALAKVWEYEDPLKDVHGPFDAAQIINWFAQDWFGTDLKIRRIGQYWTQLEYVLEELKAEARGTAMPAHGGYSSAPQQVAQATTTPATSFANGTARTASFGRAAPAPAATALAPEWAGNQQDVSSVPADSWAGSAGQVEYGNDAWSGVPASSAGASRAPAAAGYRTGKQGGRAAEYGSYGAADYGGREHDYGSSGWEQGGGSRSRAAGGNTGPGVQLGADGKWERGHVIDGDGSSRRGPGRGGTRVAGGYQDYDAYGDEYGSSGRERRGTRGRRGGGGYEGDGGPGGAGGGYDRASKILEGEDDEEYGVKQARGRSSRAARGVNAPANGHNSPPPPAAAASRGAVRKGSRAETADGKPVRSVRAGGSSNKDSDKSGISEAAVAAAVAAATAGIGAVGLGDAGAEAGVGWGSTVVTGDDGWGDAGSSAVDDNGWGTSSPSKAPNTHQADSAKAAPGAAAAAAAEPAQGPAEPQQAADDVWGSSPINVPAAGESGGSWSPGKVAAAEKPAVAEETDMCKPAAAAAAAGHVADDSWGSADQSRRGSAQSPSLSASTSQPGADVTVAAPEPGPLSEQQLLPVDKEAPLQKLSGVKALIAQQEEMAKQAQGQLTPARGSTPSATPPRFATPPRSPEPESSSQQSLVKSITAGMFGRLLGGSGSPDLGAPAAAEGAGEGGASKVDAEPVEA